MNFALLKTSIFGNYDFVGKNDFQLSIKSQYKLSKDDINLIQIVISFLFMTLVIIEWFLQIENYLGLITIEICFFIFISRSIHFSLLSQYKMYSTKLESLGFYVLNEMLVILDSTKSLKDAVKFIIISDYPFYSVLFKEALIRAHFGVSLKDALVNEVQRRLFGEISMIFSKIIQTWEDGKNLASISKDNLLAKVNDEITKESENINTWNSLSNGLVFLGPPVILLFLLISGNLNPIIGIVLCFMSFIFSVITNPERHTIVLSSNNRLNILDDRKGLEFLTILANNLVNGSTFTRSIIYTLRSFNMNMSDINFMYRRNRLETFTDSFSEEKINSLDKVFSQRIVELISLTRKLSQVSEKIAGERLLIIVKELKNINGLISRGLARMDASLLQRGIMQVLGLFMLGFILGLNPFFNYMSILLNNQTDPIIFPHNTLTTDLTIIMVGLLISLFSNNKKNLINVNEINTRLLKIAFISIRFLFFLVISIVVRNFAQNKMM